MPEKFEYPTTGWSTGKMRKKGDRMREGLEGDVGDAARNFENSPLIDSIAKQHQQRMKAQGIPEQMKQYLPRSGVGAAEVRELEGIRKEKTQHLSQMKSMDKGEFNDWFSGLPSGKNIYVPDKKSIPDAITGQPDGLIVPKNRVHELQNLSPDEYDMHEVEGMKGDILVRPKKTQEGMV
jgi:hypothetical protein